MCQSLLLCLKAEIKKQKEKKHFHANVLTPDAETEAGVFPSELKEEVSRSRCLGLRLVAELDETMVSFTGGVRERHSGGGGG